MFIPKWKYRWQPCQGLWINSCNKLLALSAISAVISCTNVAIAQIIPDNTLGVESSSLLQGDTAINGQSADIIGSGASRGGNLFHSFETFNIAVGQQVYFKNPAGIVRIMSRVTGNQPSSILGTLGVQGDADLFLMNPNGILFGPQSKLDINGSFIGTTAERLIFEQNVEFRADNPQVSPQLSINVPLGLQFNRPPADIVAQGSGHQLLSRNPLFAFSERTGSRELDLTVNPAKTLALLGGTIDLKGSILTAPGGSIQLGGVKAGFVSMGPSSLGWTFNYQNVQSFGDIHLSQQALVDGSGIDRGLTGTIQVQGNRLSLNDGSLLRIRNQGNHRGRSLVINASDSVSLIGTNPSANIRSGLIATSLKMGRGSDIFLSTPKLMLQDGGLISASTIGPGPGGTLIVNATESIDVLGTSPLNPLLLSLLSTSTAGSGHAGDAFISTKRLRVMAGGLVTSATLSTGKGGDLTVSASETVELVGVGPALFANSAVSASGLNSGDAGNLTINTQELVIKDGARVDASTFASGAAGSVTINASESVEVSGIAPGGRDSSLIISSANLLSPALRAAFILPPMPTGEAGSVTVATKDLRVTNGAAVSVRNDGPGDAGTLQIDANHIVLANQGRITASTQSGNGGDINLQVKNSLLLQNNSLISATANGLGDGGNINVNADLIVAFPTENSDIVADSVFGRGGKISITSKGLFGLAVRNQRTDLSEITAISQTNPTLNGIVEINNPEVDPSDSLTDLPEAISVPQTIAQGCRAGQSVGNSQFVHVGRGGLPSDPGGSQTASAVWHDLRGFQIQQALTLGHKRHSDSIPNKPEQSTTEPEPASPKIIEAQGWIHNPQGQTVLTAKLPPKQGLSQRQPSATC